MSSNLACVGLPNGADDLEALLREVTPRLVPVGRQGTFAVERWEDSSGARLVLRRRKGEIVSFVPSFSGRAGAFVANGREIAEEVWHVAVVDASGEQETVATVDLEEDGLVAIGPKPLACSIVALGQQVSVYQDADEFAASDDSLLDPSGSPSEPPPFFAERGWPWPPRMGPESFMSYGIFGPPAEATTMARLNGLVLRSERRRNTQTGSSFSVARVRTLGMEIDLCLAADEHPDPPDAGRIVGGVVYLVASVNVKSAQRPSLINRVRSWIQ